MQIGGLYRRDNGRLCVTAQRTVSAWERARGLLGRAAPGAGEGLIISPCASVHTFWMRYAIDVVYLDREWTILSIVDGLRPWRMSWGPGAIHVLEMAAGEAQRLDLEEGQRLSWSLSRDVLVRGGPAMS